MIELLDNLYLLRGGAFLADLILDSDLIKEVIRDFQRVWFNIHNELYQIIMKELDGSSGWLNIWAPGRTAALQCDISGMVSKKMFEKFFAPMLEEQAKWLDYSIYHLDSPEIAVHHLDAILDIPDIGAIQWALATTSIWQWIPALKKVQKAGKGLVLDSRIKKEDIEPLIKELSPKGLLFRIGCDSVAEAKALLKMAEHASRYTK